MSYISSLAVVIIGNPGCQARNGAIYFWQCSSKSASGCFVVVGNVVMPDHIHLLISEPEKGDPSRVMQAYNTVA